MSAKLIGMAFLTTASPTDKLVLIALADQQWDDAGAAYPSLETLTLMTSLSLRSVRYSLRSLAEAGHITQLSAGGGRFRSARYRVHPKLENEALLALFRKKNPARAAGLPPENGHSLPVMAEESGSSCPVSESYPAPGARNPAPGARNPAGAAPETLSIPSDPLAGLLPAGVGAGAGAYTRVNQGLGWDPDIGWTGMTQDLQNMLRSAYPKLDLGLELAKADTWLQQNPKKRKSNYFAFLTNWLAGASPSRRAASDSEDMLDPQKKEGGGGTAFAGGSARPAPAGWRGAFEAVFGRAPDEGWGSLPQAVHTDVRDALRKATELELAAWLEHEKERGAA